MESTYLNIQKSIIFKSFLRKLSICSSYTAVLSCEKENLKAVLAI